MRYASLLFVILFGLLVTTPKAQADQLKTGIMKSAPSPNQITSTPKPTPQVPDVKTAPGVTAPVPTKQGITAPLGQKATIAVKSPAQGTQHPTGKPLGIVWDRSTIPAAATVNILLVDKPGGTPKATIKAGAPNTGSFTSWIAPQQYTAAGNSWAIRIETADSKASGHSGTFSFIQQPVAGTGVVPSVKSGVAVQAPTIAGEATNLAVTKNAASKSTLAAQTPGIAAAKGSLTATPQTSSLSQDQGSATPLLNELKLGKRKDFSRVSLAGLDLSNLNLEQVNFEGADLSGADMTGADLTRCDFTGANLIRANLTKANCQGVSFKNAQLGRAIFIKTSILSADFTGATCNETLFKWMDILGDGNEGFSKANLESAIFEYCSITFHNLKNTNMKHVVINGGNFRYIDFRGAQLDGIRISGNPEFHEVAISIKYINLFQGKTDSFPNIIWVN